jgi:ATP-binding cassette, subfamily C (CFTR/MRP), member 1
VTESWPVDGKIIFDNVSLRYRPSTELVLKNIGIEIKPGQKVGIVGRTGSGKSTTALTLSRILELEQGNIYINNKDIAKIGLERLRSKVTVIP